MSYLKLLGIISGVIIISLLLIVAVVVDTPVFNAVRQMIPFVTNESDIRSTSGDTLPEEVQVSNIYTVTVGTYNRRQYTVDEMEKIGSVAIKGPAEFRQYLKDVFHVIEKDPAAYELVNTQLISLEVIDAADQDNIMFGINDQIGEGAGVVSYPVFTADSNPGFKEFMTNRVAVELVLSAKMSQLAQNGHKLVRYDVPENLKQSNEATWEQYTVRKNEATIEALRAVQAFITTAGLPQMLNTMFENRIEYLTKTVTEIKES